MRPYILYALVKKEWHRHLSNRGGLALALLLVAAAVMLSAFNPGGASPAEGGNTGMVGGVHTCVIEYHTNSPLIDHLKKSRPDNLKIEFRDWQHRTPGALIDYGAGTSAIQLRNIKYTGGGRETLSVQVWHPDADPQAMQPYEQWFWKETRRHYQDRTIQELKSRGIDTSKIPPVDFSGDEQWAVRASFAEFDRRVAEAYSGPAFVPEIKPERQGLGGKVLDFRSLIATGMVVFALYFSCVYLLPTLNCEERERGVLLAQALSPASPIEILAAKFLFYPMLGIGLAAIIAGIYKPAVLSSLFFWLSLLAVAGAFLGIGMTIATLAKTQRAAFLGAMCYLLSVSLILFIASTNGIAFISYFAVEFHGPRILHAALSSEVQSKYWLHLGATAALACGWMTLAAWLFRRRGWQ